MPVLTAEQAGQLAEAFRELANEVGKYRNDHFAELDAGQKEELKRRRDELREQAQRFNGLSMEATLDEIEAALGRLKGATARAVAAFRKLEQIRKALSVAAALVDVGVAILSGKPSAVMGATEAVVKLLQG